MENSVKERGRVYYDGNCPMCTLIIEKVHGSSRGSAFQMEDVTKGALPENVSLEAANKEIHVVMDGKTYKNAAAILRILEEFPAWKPFVWFGRLPVIKQLLPIGYNLIAWNRRHIMRRR